jgi:hypothetical protein
VFDECGGCHAGECVGTGCETIENKAGCEELTDMGCSWTASEYSDPKNEDPSWNLTKFASPDGLQDDGSLYCDCYGNVEDCFGICGGIEGSLSDVTGVEECIGEDYATQEDCENQDNGKCIGHAPNDSNLCESIYGDGASEDCSNPNDWHCTGPGWCKDLEGEELCLDEADQLTCEWKELISDLCPRKGNPIAN